MGQHHCTVADADQSADRVAHRFHHAPHFAVTAFGDGDAVPAVGAFATAVFNRAELRRAVVEHHAVEQFLLFILAQGTQDTDRVFALQAETRVHELVGQLTRAGEQQEAFGVQVQATHRLPFAVLQARQFAKHRGAVLRIIVADDLACGLVVSDDAGGRRVDPDVDRLAIDFNLVTVLHALADVGRLVVDHDAAFSDEFFHLQARAHARLRQHFVQLGRIGLGGEHTFAQIHRDVLGGFFVVKLTRHNIGQGDRFVNRFAGCHRLGWARSASTRFGFGRTAVVLRGVLHSGADSSPCSGRSRGLRGSSESATMGISKGKALIASSSDKDG